MGCGSGHKTTAPAGTVGSAHRRESDALHDNYDAEQAGRHDPHSLADGRRQPSTDDGHRVKPVWLPWTAWLRRELSQDTFDRLHAELEDLRTRGRIDIARAIEAARALGDLSENGDYHAAKDAQGKMEARIRQLEAMLADVVIVDQRGSSPTARSAPGRSSSLRYVGDDDVERYLIGSIEERREGVSVVSPNSPARPGPDRQEGGRSGLLRRPERHPRGRDRRGRRLEGYGRGPGGRPSRGPLAGRRESRSRQEWRGPAPAGPGLILTSHSGVAAFREMGKAPGRHEARTT